MTEDRKLLAALYDDLMAPLRSLDMRNTKMAEEQIIRTRRVIRDHLIEAPCEEEA